MTRAQPDAVALETPQNAVLVENLSFDFGAGPILTNVNLTLPPGSRCLLVGANGAGMLIS